MLALVSGSNTVCLVFILSVSIDRKFLRNARTPFNQRGWFCPPCLSGGNNIGVEIGLLDLSIDDPPY